MLKFRIFCAFLILIGFMMIFHVWRNAHYCNNKECPQYNTWYYNGPDSLHFERFKLKNK